jgi:hypothetical protein
LARFGFNHKKEKRMNANRKWMGLIGGLVLMGLIGISTGGELTVDGVIQHLPPQGDLRMGPYTNGVGVK